MVAPSPDWFIGVHDLSLREEGAWLPEVTRVLWPHDAGTEEGEGFTLSNPETPEPEPIRRLDTLSGSVFYNTPSLGTFAFRLTSISADHNGNGVVGLEDYTVWLDTYGSTTDLRADSDGSGVVDIGDYHEWANNFGTSVFEGSGSGISTGGSAVPEPTTPALLLAALVVTSYVRVK